MALGKRTYTYRSGVQKGMLSPAANRKRERTVWQPIYWLYSGVTGCFSPRATGIDVLVGGPVLPDKERAWMAVSEGEGVHRKCRCR
jgi:hypothetical protein